jgi:hypothetical protein
MTIFVNFFEYFLIKKGNSDRILFFENIFLKKAKIHHKKNYCGEELPSEKTRQ